jgi:hypothetical protein
MRDQCSCSAALLLFHFVAANAAISRGNSLGAPDLACSNCRRTGTAKSSTAIRPEWRWRRIRSITPAVRGLTRPVVAKQTRECRLQITDIRAQAGQDPVPHAPRSKRCPTGDHGGPANVPGHIQTKKRSRRKCPVTDMASRSRCCGRNHTSTRRSYSRRALHLLGRSAAIAWLGQTG